MKWKIVERNLDNQLELITELNSELEVKNYVDDLFDKMKLNVEYDGDQNWVFEKVMSINNSNFKGQKLLKYIQYR